MPAPVGPVSRNRPASLSSSKSTVSVPANGPNAETVSWCSRISRRPSGASSRTSASRSGVDAAGVAGELEQQRLLGGRLEVADLLRRSRSATSRSLRPSTAGQHRAARCGSRPRARSASISVCGNRAAQPVHRAAAAGAGRSASTCSQCVLGAGELGSASRSSRRPRRRRQPPGHRGGDEVGPRRHRRRRGRPARSPWSGRPRRTSRPAGSRCSARSRSSVCRPVQVAERGVVDAGEQRGRDDLRCRRRRCPARCRRPSAGRVGVPATNACASTTDRVPGAGGEVGVDPRHRRGQRRLVAAGRAGPRRRGPRRARGRGCA